MGGAASIDLFDASRNMDVHFMKLSLVGAGIVCVMAPLNLLVAVYGVNV